MEFFNEHVIPPSIAHLELLRYLLVLILAVYVPYMSIVVGSTVVSVLLNWRDRDVANRNFGRLAHDLAQIAVPSWVVALVLGGLPLAGLWLIYGQWLYQSAATPLRLFPAGALTILAGFVPLLVYRRTLRPEGRNSAANLAVGVLGLAALLLGTYLLTTVLIRVNDPERWHLAQSPFRMTLSFNVIWKYTYFLFGGLAASGGALLFFGFAWPGRRRIADAGYAAFVKNFGAGLALACVLPIPVVGFFYMVTTPIIAMSGAVYAIAVASVFLLFLIFVYLYRTLLSPTSRFGGAVFVLFLAFFFLMGIGDQLTLVNATREHSAKLASEAEEIAAKIELEREALHAAAIEPDPVRGKEVFETVCVTCHRMGRRLVGPPLETVLPKYVGKPDDLVAFVQKPVKRNPDYPPMPAPGLSLADTKSVVAYLLEKIQSGQ